MNSVRDKVLYKVVGEIYDQVRLQRTNQNFCQVTDQAWAFLREFVIIRISVTIRDHIRDSIYTLRREDVYVEDSK